MVPARLVVLLLLAATVLCFALHALTGMAMRRRRGLMILKWTVLVGLGRAHNGCAAALPCSGTEAHIWQRSLHGLQLGPVGLLVPS